MLEILKDRDKVSIRQNFSQRLRFKNGITGERRDKEQLLLERVHAKIVEL